MKSCTYPKGGTEYTGYFLSASTLYIYFQVADKDLFSFKGNIYTNIKLRVAWNYSLALTDFSLYKIPDLLTIFKTDKSTYISDWLMFKLQTTTKNTKAYLRWSHKSSTRKMLVLLNDTPTGVILIKWFLFTTFNRRNIRKQKFRTGMWD